MIEAKRINDPGPGYLASLWNRFWVGLVLVLVLIPAIFVGSYVFFVVAGLFLALAVLEVIRAPGKRYGWWVYLVTYGVVYGYVYWFVIKGNAQAFLALAPGESFVFSIENYFRSLDISVIGIATALFLYFVLAFFDSDFSFGDIAYFFTFTLLLGLGFQSFFFLRYHPFFLVMDAASYPAFVWVNGLSGPALI